MWEGFWSRIMLVPTGLLLVLIRCVDRGKKQTPRSLLHLIGYQGKAIYIFLNPCRKANRRGLGQQANAECPTPTRVLDSQYTAVQIFAEEDLNVFEDGCPELNTNLGISGLDETVTNFTIRGLKAITGQLTIINSPGLEFFQFPDLVNVTGSPGSPSYISINNLPRYNDFNSFPSLENAEAIFIDNVPALKTFRGTTRMKHLNSLRFNSTGLEEILLNDVSGDSPLDLVLANNTKLSSFKMPYIGNKNANITIHGQPRNASLSFPFLESVGTFSVESMDGEHVSAPAIKTIKELWLNDMTTTMDSIFHLQRAGVIFITNSKLDSLAFPVLTKLTNLIIRNTTVASEKLDLPFLKTLNIMGSDNLEVIDVSYTWPPGSEDALNLRLSFDQDVLGIYFDNSTFKTLNLGSRVESLNSGIYIKNMACFNCQDLLGQLVYAEVHPKAFDCMTGCGPNISLASQNWTLAQDLLQPVSSGHTESQFKVPIIGGVVGSVAGLVLIILVTLLIYKRCMTRRKRNPSIPPPPVASEVDGRTRRVRELPVHEKIRYEMGSPQELRFPGSTKYEMQG